jgi:hypothetical protein
MLDDFGMPNAWVSDTVEVVVSGPAARVAIRPVPEASEVM